MPAGDAIACPQVLPVVSALVAYKSASPQLPHCLFGSVSDPLLWVTDNLRSAQVNRSLTILPKHFNFYFLPAIFLLAQDLGAAITFSQTSDL